MNSFFVNLALGFVVKELAAAGSQVDWAAAKASFDAHITAIVHDSTASADLIALANGVVDVAAVACQDEADIESLLSQVAAQNWTGALATLKGLIAKAMPQSAVGSELAAFFAPALAGSAPAAGAAA